MSTDYYDPERRTVPRWRLWRDAVNFGELNVSRETRVPSKPNPNDLARVKLDWETHRTIPFAGDFLSKAYALGLGSLATEAAEFVLGTKLPISKALHDLASDILKGEAANIKALADPVLRTEEYRHNKIHKLRSTLHEFPLNPLVYMDLAREYVAIGQDDSANKPVEIALALAPNSRFILRAASRFYLHIRDRERAHDILHDAEILKTDPWLIAAEIAVASAAGRTSSLIKTGHRLVESGNYHPSQVSELASALGTHELDNGKIRLMKRLFHRALEKPTENTVAQASWVFRRLGGIPENIDLHLRETPGSYEARSWAHIINGQWKESLDAATFWQRDEPFASRPAIFGSWIALITGTDYTTAERFALNGLKVQPDNFFLMNNLVVALIYKGNDKEAATVFNKIKKQYAEEGPYKCTYLATKGLLQFRRGNIADGRILYRMALEEATGKGNFQLMVWVLLYLAREEFRHDPVVADKLIKEALFNFPKLSKVEQLISGRLFELVKIDGVTQNI